MATSIVTFFNPKENYENTEDWSKSLNFNLKKHFGNELIDEFDSEWAKIASTHNIKYGIHEEWNNNIKMISAGWYGDEKDLITHNKKFFSNPLIIKIFTFLEEDNWKITRSEIIK